MRLSNTSHPCFEKKLHVCYKLYLLLFNYIQEERSTLRHFLNVSDDLCSQKLQPKLDNVFACL